MNEEGEKAYALHTDIKSERPEPPKKIVFHKGRIRTLYIFNHFGVELVIEFRKKKAPPYTHRVYVGGLAQGWLHEKYKPSLKSAEYFYNKYAPLVQMMPKP